MARKRGGLAGLYDRNKGLIRTAATIGGSLLGGPAAGAAIGAAFRGLDREGKSGIGFDVGQGLRGAAEGYTTGKLTGAAKSSIGKMLAPKLPSVMAPDAIGMTNTMLGGGAGAGAGVGGGIAGGMGAIGNAASAPDVGSLTGSIGRKATKALDFANKSEKPLGAMIRGTGLVPNPEAEALAAKNQIEQDRLGFERQQYADMQGRQMRTAQLLAPLYQQMMGTSGMGSTTGVIAQPPSAFLANSGPTSLSNYVDLSGANNPRPVPLSRGTELGNYLNDIGVLDEKQYSVPSGVRYAQAYRPASPAPMSRRSRGGYVRYD